MPSPIDLTKDPDFLARIKLLFAAASYQSAITSEGKAPDVRLRELQGLVQALAPVQADFLVQKAALLVVGSPEVMAAGAEVSDQDLASVVGRVLAAFQEYSALGGSL